MKRINKLLITTIFSAAYSAHADFIPLDLLDSDLNDQSIYAGGGLTLGNSTVVGGNLQGASTVTTGVDTEVIVGGNIEARTTATTGADSKVGGYIQAGTTVNTGVGSTVFGNIYSGTTTGTGATSTVKGSIEAGGLYSAGIGATVVGPISDNLASDPSYEAPTVKIQKTQLDAVQQTLNDLGTTLGSTSRDITFGVADETLTSGIYDSGNYLSIRAGITLTLDGENKDGDFLFNIHNYLEFAAGAKIELINFTDNSRVIWNVIGGYAQAAADVNIRGFIFAKGYVLTGVRTTIKGVGSFCGGAFSVNDTVSFGADNIIGEQNCKVTNFLVAPDHFVISHDNSGIHCAAETVSVTAKNADGTTLTSYTGTITLDTQTGNGSWSLSSGSGTLTDGTADDGLATYAYAAGDNGVSTFALDYSEGTATFDIDAYDGAVRDDDSEGDITFAASGFILSPAEVTVAGTFNDIFPTQISATDFPVHITAFGTTATDPTCGIIETYTGNKSIGFLGSYQNPTSGTIALTINGTDIAMTGAATLRSINFSSGKAEVTANYRDAGIVPFSVTDSTGVNTITETTNNFVVKPAEFVFSNVQRVSDNFPNPAATSAGGGVFIAAGEDFNVTVSAENSLGQVTPNYGNETLADGIRLTRALVEPSGAGGTPSGTPGTLTGALSKQSGGVFAGTFSWDEVGIISLTAQVTDNDYLGTGDITKLLSHVGRFIPHHFTLGGLINGELEDACIADSFTYSGQSIGYDTLLTTPGFTITARSESGAPTTNYTGLFGKLGAGSATVPEINADGTQNGSDGTTPMVISNGQAAKVHTDSGAGVHSYTLGADTFSYVRNANALIGAFDSDINIAITSVIDGDSVSSTFSSANILSPASTNIRYGRISMKNAHGSELIALEIPATIEIYDDSFSSFIPHSADTCTTAPTYTVTDIDATDDLDATTLTHSISANSSGRFVVTLDPPGAGLAGGALVTLDAPPHLEFNHGAASDPEPSAKGTFGIYKSNPVQIYIQQTYQ
jgi:hypothetical protein